VGARDTCDRLRSHADEFICLHSPIRFHSVGEWYEEFDQVSDDEVVALLAKALHAQEGRATGVESRQ